jgi:hypothetical protein
MWRELPPHAPEACQSRAPFHPTLCRLRNDRCCMELDIDRWKQHTGATDPQLWRPRAPFERATDHWRRLEGGTIRLMRR